MKTKPLVWHCTNRTMLAMLAMLSMLNVELPTAFAQGTAFTYQGQLNANGGPANGIYDLQFILFTTYQFGFPAAPILTNAAVPVNNGLFTASLDFGSGVFVGTNYWMEIGVRTNGIGAFTTLAPRQPITPVPYAITAENLASVVENNFIQNGVPLATIGGGGNNTIQSGANGSTIGGGGPNSIGTNSFVATIAGGANNSIGANDDTSTIGGGNQNIIQDGAGVSTIAGGVGNTIQKGSPRSTISGGSNNRILINAEHSFIGGGDVNQIQNSAYSSIVGGALNQIQSGATFSIIGAGAGNVIQTNCYYSTIGGGDANAILTPNGAYSFVGGGGLNTNGGYVSVIAGGARNTIQSEADHSVIVGGGSNLIVGTELSPTYSVIGGGNNNQIQTNVSYATIGGGSFNTIQTDAVNAVIGGGANNTNAGAYAAIPGGANNVASGTYSFAAGLDAQALHRGTFVWSDSQGSALASTASNQFLIRAAGGMGINTNNPNGASLYVKGNRTGGWGSSVGFFENSSVAAGSSPALRVVVDGGSAPDGALNVSDNGTGPIAEFGNGIGYVASVENDGTIKSKGVILTSDQNAKENFSRLDNKSVLAKILSLPITQWNYKDDSSDKRHIGPVAQDFHAAFGLNGDDDRHISVGDEVGVALAAIQGLNQKLAEELQQKKAEITELKRKSDALEKRLETLETIVLRQKPNGD